MFLKNYKTLKSFPKWCLNLMTIKYNTKIETVFGLQFKTMIHSNCDCKRFVTVKE